MKNKKSLANISNIKRLELYKRASLFLSIGNDAVHSVQEKNRKLGIPNVYGMNGNVFFEMPDGKIVTESPWKKLYKKQKMTLR